MRRVFALVAVGFLTLTGAGFGAVKSKTAHSVSLRATVQALLPLATSNFDNIRGPKHGSDIYYVSYKVSPTFKVCTNCTITDEYARGPYVENWYLDDRWDVSKTWNAARAESYAKTQLSPLLAGFTLHRALAYKYPTLEWRNAANVWVVVDAYKQGFTLKVGHDLPNGPHVVLPPSKVQVQQLRNSLANFIHLAVPAASDNFSSLRSSGSAGKWFAKLTTSFGSMLRNCESADFSKNDLKIPDYQPKWTLSCDTAMMAGTKKELLETVRSAVYDALPYGFSATTDKKYLFLDDYRWDNTSDVAVSIGSDFLAPKGLIDFHVNVTHFLPKSS